MNILAIILWSLLLVLLAVILWLLMARIRLTIDSNSGVCKVNYQGIGVASVQLKEEDINLHLQVLFWKKDQSLIQLAARPQTKVLKPEKEPGKKTKSKISRKKMIQLLKSFKVKEFSGTIDTDNYIWNAFLYPAFYWLGARKGRFPSINFLGRNEVKLIIENRLVNILYAWMKRG